MLALVTRPREDAEGVVRLLRERGIDAVVEPLLRIVPLAGVSVPLDGAQAILATSANGVRALAAATPVRDLPVLAVGDASARCAREHGFAEVLSAEGDADSLVALVRERLDPAAGALVHAAGTTVAGDVSGALAAAGYEVRRVVLYEAQVAEALSPGLKGELAAGKIDLALFFSPRTARTFVNLLRGHGLDASCAGIAAYCLSRAVAEQLAPLPWGRLRVAARPDMASLMAALDGALSGKDN